MSQAPITAQRLREVLHYAPETGQFTRRIDTPGCPAGAAAGSVNGGGYVLIKVDGVRYSAHRLAWLFVNGEWPRATVDHINGQRADNRIANLRDVSRGENSQNRRGPQSSSKTGLLGASRNGRRFAARIKVNGRGQHLGQYDTPEEAHAAYVTAKRVIHPACTI
jgi:hypothetical protein